MYMSMFNVIWDFDNSLIDTNSDNFIIQTLDKNVYEQFLDAETKYSWPEPIREGFGLHKMILDNNISYNTNILYWKDGRDINNHMKYIASIIS